MGPLAALLARLGPAALRMAGAARSIPLGAAVPRSLYGKIGTPQRIGRGDIVQQDEEDGERLGDVFKKLTVAATGSSVALAVLPNTIHAVSSRFVEAQRALTQYNATIAVAFHKLDVGRIQRDIRRGGATAGTTRELADSTNRLEEALQPIGNLTTNFKNIIGDALNEAAIILLKPINKILDKFGLDKFGLEEINPTALQRFLDDRRNEWLDEQKRLREPALDLDRINGRN